MDKDDEPTPRQVLSENLRSLLREHPRLTTIRKVVEETKDYRINKIDAHLTNGKVGRIYAGSHTTDIDTLHSLARAFGIEPWHLLVPKLSLKSLPHLADEKFLSQIAEIVRTAASTTTQTATVAEAAHPVERKSGLGPALKRATDVKGLGNAPRKSVRVQKTGTRRRV